MPELAEVEYFRKKWNPGLGQKIASIHLQSDKRVFRGTSPTLLARKIRGRTLRSSHAHGKQMLFRFGSDAWLGLHLGMTGRLLTASSLHRPSSHDHLVLRTTSHSLIFRDPRLFGRVRFAVSPRAPTWWSQLPPPILSPKFTASYLRKICARRARAPLKALLLMQQFFPGIGNWMADEILWRAAIHPQRRAGSLQPTEIRTLWCECRRVARLALRMIAGHGEVLPPDLNTHIPRTWLFHHRWADGGRCPKTHQPLLRAAVGGRTTCWCPARPPCR